MYMVTLLSVIYVPGFADMALGVEDASKYHELGCQWQSCGCFQVGREGKPLVEGCPVN